MLVNVNQNPEISLDEARSLKYPRLMEVWTTGRSGRHDIIISVGPHGGFNAASGAIYWRAAHPSEQTLENLSHQVPHKSEYPKRMLVWDGDEADAQSRIVLADLGQKIKYPYICVCARSEEEYEKGEGASITYFKYAKPIPEPDPLQEKRQELLAEALRLETIAKTMREQAENL